MNNGSAYTLIKPGNYPSRDKIFITDSLDDLFAFIQDLKEGEVVAVDFETNGLPIPSSGFRAVGISLAGDPGAIYCDLRGQNELDVRDILNTLSSKVNLIAHNVMYDGSVWLKLTGQHANWKYCTYGLARQWATEGWYEQRWGLKHLMVELLGWDTPNTTDLDGWLSSQGYIKGNRQGNPDYSKMSLAPLDILGKYGALDAEATWLLYHEIFKPLMEEFPAHVSQYHTEFFIQNVLLLIDQQHSGILIDTQKLLQYKETLKIQIEEARVRAINHPDVLPILIKFWENQVKELEKLEPVKYKVVKLGNPPAQFKKDGTPSKNYEKWLIKSQKPKEITINWKKWERKLDELKAKHINVFNLNSNKQLQWLLYENLFSYTVVREHLMDRPGLISVRLSDKEEIELDMTDSGSLPTDGASLIQMGEVGVLIDKYKELLKVDTFIDATLAFSSEDGRVHPEFKAPGTLTGRLAGGGDLKGHKLNIQQLPKVRGYLETWVSDPGKIIIQADFSALENVVLAELSRDKALFDLYGPGRPNQDIYLYTGAGIAAIQKNILKSGYDPQNPTDEAIAKAKKEAKKERGISKVLVLSSGYGAGPHKIWKTLKAQKVDVSLQEVKQMHQDYWNLYKGIKDFEADVEREWYQNKGWVLNGLGRPIGIFHQKKKDLVNRVIQSTGHDCLMIVIVFLKEELDKEGIEWMPWIIDLHDELMFQVNLKDKEKAMACVDRAVKRLNLFLGGEIPLKMEPGAFTNLADIKVES